MMLVRDEHVCLPIHPHWFCPTACKPTPVVYLFTIARHCNSSFPMLYCYKRTISTCYGFSRNALSTSLALYLTLKTRFVILLVPTANLSHLPPIPLHPRTSPKAYITDILHSSSTYHVLRHHFHHHARHWYPPYAYHSRRCCHRPHGPEGNCQLDCHRHRGPNKLEPELGLVPIRFWNHGEFLPSTANVVD